MIAFIRLSPPLLNGARWSIASVANITHLEYAVRAVLAAPLPVDLIGTPSVAAASNWGQLLAALVPVFAGGLWQLVTLACTHPQDAAVVVWWVWECHDLKKTMGSWLKARRSPRE